MINRSLAFGCAFALALHLANAHGSLNAAEVALPGQAWKQFSETPQGKLSDVWQWHEGV